MLQLPLSDESIKLMRSIKRIAATDSIVEALLLKLQPHQRRHYMRTM